MSLTIIIRRDYLYIPLINIFIYKSQVEKVLHIAAITYKKKKGLKIKKKRKFQEGRLNRVFFSFTYLEMNVVTILTIIRFHTFFSKFFFLLFIIIVCQQKF